MHPLQEALIEGLVHKIVINDEEFYTYSQNINIKHPEGPINFKQEIDFRTRVTVLHEYKDWVNIFEYDFFGSIASGTPICSKTINKRTKNLIAELQAIKIENGKLICIERHFEDATSNIKYEAIVFISIGTGMKEKEIVKHGLRKNDFHPIWPTSKYS